MRGLRSGIHGAFGYQKDYRVTRTEYRKIYGELERE